MSNVTVILVTYNSQPHLPDTLAGLRLQGEGVQLAVVDNASQDGSVALVRQLWPEVRLIVNVQNVGFAAAINQLLPHLHTPYILLLNPDAVLLPEAIPQLVKTMAAYPNAAAVGPRQWLDQPGGWQWNIVPYPPHWSTILLSLISRTTHHAPRRWVSGSRFQVSSLRLRQAWQLNRAIWWGMRPQIVPYLSGACMLLRRDVFQTIGGMDEGYFLFFEDTELSLRLRRAGWQLWADPQAGVRHGWMGSVNTLPDKGQTHLLASGTRFLYHHADSLTRWLWITRQKRWARKTSEQLAVNREQLPASSLQSLVSSFTHHAPHTTPYCIEVGLEPTFLYAAAIQTDDPTLTLPPALVHRPVYVRLVGCQTHSLTLS